MVHYLLLLDLTFSDDLNLIVDETKFRIRRNIDQGIIGVGTIDNQNFPNDDAIKLAETIGANPLAISTLKLKLIIWLLIIYKEIVLLTLLQWK